DRFLGVVGEVILGSRQLRSVAIQSESSVSVQSALDSLERRIAELQRRALELRTTRMSRVMDHLPRSARQIADRLGKEIEVALVGDDLEIDRAILDRLGEPLLHLVRNAVDHGLEGVAERESAGKSNPGQLLIEAQRHKEAIRITVRDDGRGVDLDKLRIRAIEAGRLHPDLAEDLTPDQIAPFVFEAGLSTADEVSEVSGRGVGMEAVKTATESLGGQVEIATEPGKGTRTTLTVPISAAVQKVLVVEIGEQRLALPLHRIESVLEVEACQIEDAGGESFLLVEGDPVLVLDLAQAIRVPDSTAGSGKVHLVLTEWRGERVALRVDAFADQHEIYVKPVPDLLSPVRMLAGLTLLEDGSPVFLLDVNQVA
ncbi:chemotaxis protein CheW, partial [Myxococcota bacterium]|nr:chemotaxis protein CheW [Myxococcota bacterium]